METPESTQIQKKNEQNNDNSNIDQSIRMSSNLRRAEIGNSFLQKIKSRRYWSRIGLFIYNGLKILLTLGLAVLAGFYAFAVTSAMPVLFGGGIVLAVVFGFYTISNIIGLFKALPKGGTTRFKPAYFRSIGTVLLGAALIALGVLLLVAPLSVGALFGVGIAVKIGLIAAGALFAAKGISDGIIQTRQPKGKLKNIFARFPHFLLNIAPVVLGILAIVVGISTGIPYLPVAIAAIFAMRFASHVLRALSKPTKTEEKGKIEMVEPIVRPVSQQPLIHNENENVLASIDDNKLNSQNKCMTAARVLDNLSLMAIGGGLIVAGALFAAPLAAAIGIPVLFAQISLLVIGSLSALMGLTKFFIGPMIESLEEKINLIIPSSVTESDHKLDNNSELGDSLRPRKDSNQEQSATIN